MGYIKVAYRKILNHLDYYSELPRGWNEFIKEQEKLHNLIIKSSKNKCFCTNCHHHFISTKKVKEEVKCPNCHNKYLIKRSNLKYYEFKDYFSILDRVDNTFVIRYFELKTILDAMHESHSSVVEFAREILLIVITEKSLLMKEFQNVNVIFIYIIVIVVISMRKNGENIQEITQ